MFPKLKMIKIYRNLAHLYFKYPGLYFNVKNNFYEILTTCQAQIGPKIKNTQNLLKFGSLDISNMPISILMQKMSFLSNIYQLLGPKLVPKLKMLRIY